VVGFFGGTGAQGGQFANPADAAVNLNGTGGATAGDLYVVDRGNRRIQQFHADGTWVRAFGIDVIAEGKPNDISETGFEICDLTAATPNVPSDCKKGATAAGTAAAAGGMNGPQGIAVEQSTGNLYVTDQGNRRVDVYSATGSFEGAFGWNVNETAPAEELQLCTTSCQAGSISEGAGSFGFSGMGYASFDPQGGNLLIASRANRRIDEFAPTITGVTITGVSFVRAYGWGVATGAAQFEVCTTTCLAGLEGAGAGQFGASSPSAVAADSTGRVYAVDLFNNRVQAFSSTLSPEGDFAPSKLSGAPEVAPPVDLVVEGSTNHVFVTKPCTALACPGAISGENRVLELDSAGNLIASHAKGAGIPSSTGLALGTASRLYMTTASGGPDSKPGFFIVGPQVLPQVTIAPVSVFTGTTATFEGHVTTDTIGAKYHFEYSADGATWTRLPEEGTVPSSSSSQLVSVNATGLEAHTEYQARLIAEKEYAGGSASAQTSFTTGAAAPLIVSASHSHVRDTSALLEGTVNPENEDTEYSFEYTDEATYEAEGFASATSVPAPPGHVNGAPTKAISEQLAGLTQKITYVYRLLISNPSGDDESTVGSFTTHAVPQSFEACLNDQLRVNRPSGALPDCRAYEQASPVKKNGGNIQSEYFLNKASPSGDRISFLALAGLPGGEGSQTFPTFIASRGDGKWSAQGVLPAASSGDGALVKGWTPDFDQVFSTVKKLGVGTGIVSRSSQGGALSTVAPYVSSLAPATVQYASASADGSIAFFGVPDVLPVAPGSNTPAPGLHFEGGIDQKNLYAWDRETGDLYFAGVLPDGSAAAKGAQAGLLSGAGYSIDSHAVADDGSVYFTDQATGQLYRRFNPTAPETTNRDPISGDCIPDPDLACTVHVSASEKTDGGGTEGHDAAGSQATRFMAASTDGAKAIFTSSEKLTDGAYTGFEPEPAALARADKADGGGVNRGLVPLSENSPTATASDEDHLYWVEPDANSIGRSDIDGQDVVHGFITGTDNPYGVAVDAGHIYWTNQADGVAGTGTIGRADLNGDDPATNVTQSFITGATDPKGIDVDANYIYWSNADDHIARAELADGGNVNLELNGISNANGDVEVDAESIYFSYGRPASETVFGSGFISRRNLDGSGRQERLIDLAQPPGTRAPALAVDDSRLYWTDTSGNTVGRQNLAGVVDSFSTAVNSHGDLFVLNRWEGVSIFAPSGEPIAVTHVPGAFSGDGSFSLAVDSQGNLYIKNHDGGLTAGGTVLKFKPSNPGSAPTPSTTYSLDKSIGESSPGANDGDGAIAFGATYAVAVDPSNDNVYVAEGDHISEYQPNGTLVTNTIGAGVSGARYVGIEVYGANHNVYAADAANRNAGKAYIFSSGNLSGPPSVTIDGSNTPGGSLSFQSGFGAGYSSKIAIDQSNGHAYVADDNPHNVIEEFDAAGAFLSQFTFPSFPSFAGVQDLSVDNSGGATEGVLYVASGGISNNENLVDAFAKGTHQRIPALSRDGYEAAFITVSGPLGVAAGEGADSGHFYWTTSRVAQPNNGSDLYSYDTEAPAGKRLTDLATSHDGKDGIEVQGVLGASADASYVYFVANGVPDGDVANSPNARNEEAQQGNCKGTFADLNVTGSCNLYLAHEGEVTFITRLDAENVGGVGQGSTSDALNWVASPGEIGTSDSATEKTARVSADGKTLLFRSQRQLTGYDNEGPKCRSDLGLRVPGPCAEFYRYRVDESGLVCVSCNPTGAPPFWRATLVSIKVGATTTKEPAPQLSRNLSADGNRVFFETADALVTGDTNGDEGCEAEVGVSWVCQDVYEWEAAGTGSCPASAGQQGCIYLLSTGKSPDPSFFADASLSGDDAFLLSYSKLVRQDEDDQLDVYDASVDGGLSAQDALPPVPCEGEACKGGTTSAPQSPSARSESFAGPANPKAVHKKAKKRKKKRRHHAKKRSHAKHHRANADGRASR
jgi:hypothetical protein